MSALIQHFQVSKVSSNATTAPRAAGLVAAAPRMRLLPAVVVAVLSLLLVLSVRHADAGMITNGDFDDSTGALTGWSNSGGVTGSSTYPNPNSFAEEGTGLAIFTGASQLLGANNASPFTPGNYTVDFWLQNVSATAGAFHVGFVSNFTDIDAMPAYVDHNNNVSGGLTQVITPAVNGYNEYQFTGNATNTAGILAFGTDSNVIGDYYLDNVAASAASAAVPEPASCILWAVGLVGVARASKRARRRAA